MQFLTNPNTRKYIYRVIVALLGIFVGFTGWHAITEHQWLQLIEAVLALGSGGALLVADRHVPDSPKNRDPHQHP